MSGVEVMERIKQHDPDIEVIVVTGYSSVDTAVHALRFGVFDYVSKPFDVPHISDLVRRAVERRQATLRSRHAKEDFLSNVSHELRTPLNAILGYSSILAEELDPSLSEEQRFALRRLQVNSYELFNLVESVLLLNEFERGDVVAHVDPFELDRTVDIALQKFKPIADEKGLSLRHHLGTPGMTLISDREKIERVLCALLDNAVKFTDSGSVTVATSLADGDTIRVEVIDTGIGMRDPDSSAALEGLSQVDPSPRRRYRGLGLGFRVATRLLDLLGGRIEIFSRPGVGTRVSFYVPVRPGGGALH
jgi:signal transduction histidine kinase